MQVQLQGVHAVQHAERALLLLPRPLGLGAKGMAQADWGARRGREWGGTCNGGSIRWDTFVFLNFPFSTFNFFCAKAFVASIMLGPRIGVEKQRERIIMGNAQNSLIGLFMIWWAFLAFNSGRQVKKSIKNPLFVFPHTFFQHFWRIRGQVDVQRQGYGDDDGFFLRRRMRGARRVLRGLRGEDEGEY